MDIFANRVLHSPCGAGSLNKFWEDKPPFPIGLRGPLQALQAPIETHQRFFRFPRGRPDARALVFFAPTGAGCFGASFFAFASACGTAFPFAGHTASCLPVPGFPAGGALSSAFRAAARCANFDAGFFFSSLTFFFGGSLIPDSFRSNFTRSMGLRPFPRSCC